MNPFGAVEPISAVRGPLATLQALAEAVAAAQPQPGDAAASLTTDNAGPLLGGAALSLQAENSVPMPGPLPASVAATNALHGRMTLGQLAAEPAALRVASEAAAGEAARLAPHAAPLLDAANAQRPLDVLAVPVLLTPLQTPAGAPARPRQAPEAQRRPPILRLDPLPPEPEPLGEPPATEPEEPAPSSDAQAGALRALLQRAGQADALRELALGRRVLVVLTQAGAGHGPVAASAVLLTAEAAQRFGARWWPGAANVSDIGWLRWRVFRDGDPLLDRGLRSRTSATACRVRLGAQPQRLTDAASASLEIAERIRFTHALGPQWSLLMVAAPPGEH